MSSTLKHLLSPISQFLSDAGVEEVCVNEPDSAWVWARGVFTRHAIKLRAIDIENIAIVAAAQRRQNVGNQHPLLATDLAGSGRLQVVLPPCVAEGKPSLTIRRGSSFSPTIDQLASSGLFEKTRPKRREAGASDQRLLDLYRRGSWMEFLAEAVLARKTIVLCGETASGKTTVAKSLIDSIPRHERILTIEDTPEWTNLPHENIVSMYYDNSKGSTTAVRCRDLVEAALRMRIGRLLLQEIRDGEAALAFLLALQSGHPGGITTVHAMDAEKSFDRLRVMIKQTPNGAAVSDSDLISQLYSLIDIVVHCYRDGSVDGPGAFSISEVWYGPVALQSRAA
jgi:type IV secretion system protein VirB11